MRKGVKFRIYPNKRQKELLQKTFGCTRLVYNKALAMRKEDKGIRYKETSTCLTTWKKQEDLAFLKEVDAIALQQSLRDLDRAYQNFFKHGRGYPRFRKKQDHRRSYRTYGAKLIGKHLYLPKVGYVKVRQSMEVGKINHVTIERTPTGKYFAVLNVEFEPQPRQNKGGCIGIDVGIKDFYSDSNGKVVPNPKYLEKSMRKLIREQRKLSRKQKNSNNRNKQRVKVALVHEKITNQRNDFLQKQSTILIRENKTICIEDLKVKNMMRNHKLAQHIGSASWSKFFDMLAYKAVWHGNDVVKVPTMYPSSQTCSCCGYKNPLVKNLAVRIWECPDCHTVHNRDSNASINILNKGLQMQSA